ncbi:MAG: hypothetical protein J1E81_06195 [Eubacterium sp.]|nr:hypothetical protein [Eubacterium sp.]
MAIKDILTLISVLLGFVTTTLIPTIIVMVNRIKAVKAARTEAERQAAIDDIKTLAQDFIAEAESLYKDIDAIVKKEGKTCGAVKKDSVMTKIQDACLGKGIVFDKEYWGAYVDKQVTLTRQVNAKQ